MIKVTWLGHSAFKIEKNELIIFIDPWISGNPVTPFKNVSDVKKANYVFLTHEHGDHGFSDAIDICKNTGATFIGITDIGDKAAERGVKNIATGNIGGEMKIDDITVYFTRAIHSTQGSAPCGIIITMDDKSVYYSGDTAFFSDMSYYSKLYNIYIMIIPVGSVYTMGIKEANWAVKKVKPKHVIPMHYNTFPEIAVESNKLKEFCEKSKVNILEINKPVQF